ncbi:MAG: Holliday junction resolvase RuvX [Campylobacteraceae bacterium]|nr:Holliday junction resolvase RuvX [Campylobacteraceae bacterium]
MNIAALDIGLKRIGIALCLDNKIVMPQTPILRKNRLQASADVDTFLKEWKIETVVVGLPLNEDMKRRIKHFISLLKYGCEVIFIDEDFSSCDAKELAKGIFKQKRDGKIDSVAAAVILDRYLYALKSF